MTQIPIEKGLKQYFGFDTFRPLQKDIVEDILANRDLLVLMPTGAGKSLCYQLPSVLSSGVSIVISPLISLIYDQIYNLKKLNIPCFYWNSQMSFNEKKEIIHDLHGDRKCKLFYTTPESLVTNVSLAEILRKLNDGGMLARFIIDEAHCVSNWGHEFRPSYLDLKILREKYPKVPIVSFTATAVPKVQIDIIKQLRLNQPKIYHQSFIRPNLTYLVKRRTKDSVEEVANLIQNKYKDQTGIIYCLSRKNCEETSKELRNRGISARYYHAQLPSKEKEEIQLDWLDNKCQVIVATIAFALGINKADVRFVFHLSMPKSIEGYYQETGRAGRDGLESTCILYYSMKDKNVLEFMINKDAKEKKTIAPVSQLTKIEDMYEFCLNEIDCRKLQLSQYLGEHLLYQCENKCSNCLNNDKWKYKDIKTNVIQLQDYFKKNDKNIIQMENILDFLKKIQISQKKFNPRYEILNNNEIKRTLNYLFALGFLKAKACLSKETLGDRKIYEIVEWNQLDGYIKAIEMKNPQVWKLPCKNEFNMTNFIEFTLKGTDPYEPESSRNSRNTRNTRNTRNLQVEFF